MPFAAFAFVIASAASMGIPGFSGFAAEITILIGAGKPFRRSLDHRRRMVLVAAFTLRALKKVSSATIIVLSERSRGRLVDSDLNEQDEISDPITLAEKLGAGLLMFATLAVGLYPKFLLDRIMPAVEAMRFLKLRRMQTWIRTHLAFDASRRRSRLRSRLRVAIANSRVVRYSMITRSSQTALPEAIVVVTALAVLALGLAANAAGPLFWSPPDLVAVASSCCREHATLFHGMLVITPLTSLFKIICLVLAFFTVILARERSVAAQSRRISRAASARHHRAHASRRQRRIAHDLHRPRADRSVALRHDRVRQDRSPLRRSRPEIFPLRQHGERVHAFRTELHLWHGRHDRTRRDRAKTYAQPISAAARSPESS